MVPTPIVMAKRGTLPSPRKSAAASWRVIRSSAISRVRESRVEPGSLNPMWPVRPMPRICRSIPPACVDRRFVRLAMREHLVERHRAVGQVDVFRPQVDVVEELLPHEPEVALPVVAAEAVVFVEVEGDDPRKAQPLLAMEADQFPVKWHRGRARWPGRARSICPSRLRAVISVGHFPGQCGRGLGSRRVDHGADLFRTVRWSSGRRRWSSGRVKPGPATVGQKLVSSPPARCLVRPAPPERGPHPMDPPLPRIIIVMGVSGSGKTEVGRALATALNAPFLRCRRIPPARKRRQNEPPANR